MTLRQPPPATSKPPFMVLNFVRHFDCRVLRQNKRMVAGDAHHSEALENFHGILADISWGMTSKRVRQFSVEAYMLGAPYGIAERSELEGSTGVFTKRLAPSIKDGRLDRGGCAGAWASRAVQVGRAGGERGAEARPGRDLRRYRVLWNRTIVRRVASVHKHSWKIKRKGKARGTCGAQYFDARRAENTRKTSRTLALWNLHLAGDWHPNSDAARRLSRQRHTLRSTLLLHAHLPQLIFHCGYSLRPYP